MNSLLPKYLTHTLLITLAMAGVWGCRKDKESFQPNPVSQQVLSALLAATPSADTKTVFTFNNLQQDTVLRTAGGLQVFLTNTDQLFVAALNQNLILCSTCQTLRVEITEVLRKGDMLARKIPTLASDGTIKEGIGAVKIEVFCNNERLEVLDGRTINSVVAWNPTIRDVYEADWIVNGANQKGFELESPQTGWITGLRSLMGDTSAFCLDMPSYYSGVNTQAFLVFKDKMVVVPMPPQDNGGNTLFCADKAIIGFIACVITLSQLGDELWLFEKSTEIGGSNEEGVQPIKSNSTQILNFLRNL
jgi:hypothetical protein